MRSAVDALFGIDENSGGPSRTRTYDKGIMSPLL